MIHRHIRLAARVTKAGNRTVLLIPDNALIHAGQIHRPSIYVRESMSGSEFHGIEDAAVVPDFNGGIGPPVETVTSVAAVIECRLLLQVGAARIQCELHAPLHAVETIDIADPYRGASVAFSLQREVYGRNRHPIVRNGKVELDAERAPHRSEEHTSELQSLTNLVCR